MALYPNLGYGDQPPPQQPRPPIRPDLPDEPLPKPKPPTGEGVHSGLAPMIQALRGQQDPAMSGLFGVPHQQLQHLAGDVIDIPPNKGGPILYSDDYWKRVSQPAGYENPAAAAPLAQGFMSGKIKVLRPEGK